MSTSHTQDEQNEEILDQGLMFRCLNWGDFVCQADVKEFVGLKEKGRWGEDTQCLPTPDKLKRLNDICKYCLDACFEIFERACPSCGNRQIISDYIVSENSAAYKASQVCNLYLYKCPECGKSLFSGKEL
jgi:hypothetical protein